MSGIIIKGERLDDKGRAVTKIDGKITFVSNLLPNEEAEVKIINIKKKYNEAKVLKLLKTSSERVVPKCPYLNCGCQLKHLNYQKQLEYKQNKVKEILKKFGNITPKINKIVYDNNINHYRNKITLKVQNNVGFFQNHTNSFIPIKRCELVSEKVNNLIKELNQKDLSKVTEITIKDFDDIMLIIKGDMDISNLSAKVIYLNDKLMTKDKFVMVKLKGLTFKISKEAFFQVNTYMTEKLYDLALNYLKPDKTKTVLDLYCGTGTISLILSKHFKKVIGIELNKEAIDCAQENKKINKINNVNFICGDASKEIKKVQDKIDYIIVDPPRSGLTKEGIGHILKLNPKKVVYISCDPITLARDLNLLKEYYDIKEVTPVDMFPNTYHVENVAVLVRK
mgnify:FL=1